MEENEIQQRDELEVLWSIFGDNWKKCDSIDHSYSIKLEKDVELWITMGEWYPSDMPPQYELWAPNLIKTQRDFIEKEFSTIYETNKGMPIIFQWIEKLKEVLEDVPTKLTDDILEPSECPIDNITIERNNKVPELNIIHGDTITDRKSTFQGHVCRVTKMDEVGILLDILLENKKIRDATHNILAYRIVNEKNVILQDYDDNGETHAGGRLLHLLEILDLKNVAVVVTRWYGGIHLGPDRFKHINNAGRQALAKAGFIK